MKKIIIPFFIILFFLIGGSVAKADVGNSCGYLIKDYLSYGGSNDTTQVMLLQAYLKGVEKLDVSITGVFDEKTLSGVKDFQEKYRDEILSPWGVKDPTGYVYITTKNKINEVFCSKDIPFTDEEIAILYDTSESVIIEDADSQVLNINEGIVINLDNVKGDSKEEVEDRADSEEKVSKMKSIAAAVVTLPNNPREAAFYVLWLIFILSLVYIVGSLVSGMRNTDGLDTSEIRMRKIIYFMVGLLVGLVFVTIADLSVLILPLIVLIIALAVLLLYYFRKSS
ncbi:MAG: hypothetical protein MRY49_00155 [Candidatus Pacebacteria bacterium]|nr:hypothetical protein [Candidatus Paceibacterota bacterium]